MNNEANKTAIREAWAVPLLVKLLGSEVIPNVMPSPRGPSRGHTGVLQGSSRGPPGSSRGPPGVPQGSSRGLPLFAVFSLPCCVPPPLPCCICRCPLLSFFVFSSLSSFLHFLVFFFFFFSSSVLLCSHAGVKSQSSSTSVWIELSLHASLKACPQTATNCHNCFYHRRVGKNRVLVWLASAGGHGSDRESCRLPKDTDHG